VSFLFSSSVYPKVSDERKKKLQNWIKANKIRFKSIDLLNLSFIHRSFANENSLELNNERLEFLGDSVLGLVVGSFLFENLPKHSEGDMAKMKSYLVSEDHLSEIAQEIGIGEYLVLGKGEENSGGKNKKAILADALEAVIGAFFIDSGWVPSQEWVLKLVTPGMRKIIDTNFTKDFKTLLQEFCQKTQKVYPRYQLISMEGPDHDKVFSVEVLINAVSMGKGSGKSKKEAEQKAALEAYTFLQK